MNYLRGLWAVVLTAFIVVAGVTTGLADEKYPSRQIEMVIPFPAGGSTDISGRIFSNELSKLLKVPVIPSNKGGSAGTIAGTYVYKAKRDGYTLLTASQGWFFGSCIHEIVYDPLKDFIPIASFHVIPHALCVKKDSPIKNLEDFVDRAKKNPKAIPVGSPGTGGDGHFTLEVFVKAANIQVKHVPYKGVSDLPPAVMGGHVELGIGPASAFLPFIKSGDIRAIGMTSRMKELPDAPSFAERGFKARYFDNWAGIASPAGVPQVVIDTLIDASEKISKSKEFAEATEKTGTGIQYIRHAEFVKHLEEDRKIVEAMAKEMGLKK
jgi:tripartite-type tricarboxylate transporter receptor subunit TctC